MEIVQGKKINFKKIFLETANSIAEKVAINNNSKTKVKIRKYSITQYTDEDAYVVYEKKETRFSLIPFYGWEIIFFIEHNEVGSLYCGVYDQKNSDMIKKEVGELSKKLGIYKIHMIS